MAKYTREVEVPGQSAEDIYYEVANNIDRFLSKQPIGKYDFREPFETHTLQLLEGDLIYIFSDGYADQFGGSKGKKFMYKPFKRMLAQIANANMQEQKAKISETFNEWKGSIEQIDDVCVFGVRV